MHNEFERRSKRHLHAVPPVLETGDELALTPHARKRMTGRRIDAAAIHTVMTYGREVYAQGATHWQIGRREVHFYARQGLDLTPYEGLNVVCTANGETILTVLRNREGRRLRRA